MIRITNRFMINSEEFVRDRFGAKAWEAVRERFQPETRQMYDYTIKPKEYVDFTRVDDVLKGVAAILLEKNPNVLFDLGFHNGEKDLSATQKLVMRIISVEWVLRLAAFLWGQRVVNGGTIEIHRQGTGHVLARVCDFSMPTDEWWVYLSGWFTCAITFSGGKNVSVKWFKGGKNPKEPAEFNAKWS